MTAEQADFVSLQDGKLCGFAYAKSGCPGVGGAVKWREFAKQIFEMELHHRGSKRYITPPSRRSDTNKMYAWMLQLFKMLCVISSEETAKLHDRNGSQFAKIFYIIADTAE